MKLLKCLLLIMSFSQSFCFAADKTNPMLEMPYQDVRKLINDKIMSIEASKPEVYSVTQTTINNDDRETTVRVYKPSNKGSFPLILLIHGGAWVAGNLNTHDNLARYLSKEGNAVVLSVGYTNSPEGKYDHILEQCYDALLWASLAYVIEKDHRAL